MGQCKAGSTRSYATKKGIVRRLIVSAAFHICDENSDWALRSGVAFNVRVLETAHPSRQGQSMRAYRESSYRAFD